MSLSFQERQRRGRIVRRHVILLLVSLLVLIPLNFVVSRHYPWWLWVLMLWLPLIVAHTAWAKGLFERRKEGM